MSQKQSTGSGKRRKRGDWVSIASGRSHTPRDLINGHGLSNIPKIGDVGSAAYRRLVVKRSARP